MISSFKLLLVFLCFNNISGQFFSFDYGGCLDTLLSPENSAGESCVENWEIIKPLIIPTQKNLGWAYVGSILQEELSTLEQTLETMSAIHISVIIGPTFSTSRSVGFYLIDNHHLLAALDYSKQKRISVIFDIVCDWRQTELEEVFKLDLSTYYTLNIGRQVGENMTLLPYLIESLEEFPSYFSFKTEDVSFDDDIYMSLAAFSRKVINTTANCPIGNEDCMRCFYSECDDGDLSNTLEMDLSKWGYFFNTAIDFGFDYWPSISAYTNFNTIWALVDIPKIGNVGKIDLSSWQEAASSIIEVCRNEVTETFILPSDIFISTEVSANGQQRPQLLPGYVKDWVQLEPDDTCIETAQVCLLLD